MSCILRYIILLYIFRDSNVFCDHLDDKAQSNEDTYSFEAISTRKRKGGAPLRAKSLTKRGLQAQGYVDEKFSLKVQKKPI